MSTAPIRVEVDGRPATAEQLAVPALVNYGHFTSMQVRSGRTRGLDLHLRRLDAATKELFEAGVDPDRVRAHLRHALAGLSDATARVSVFENAGGTVSVLVAVRPPVETPSAAQSLLSVPYLRPVAHIKHAGSFAQIHYGRMAERRGFDDALLTGPDGTIGEAAISNIGFSGGGTLIWPDAPSLAGITRQLLDSRMTTRRRPIHLADLPSFAGAFVTNSLGIVPVGRIDDTVLPVDTALLTELTAAYESVPWDVI